jgi:hypothetical protein
LYPGEPEPQIIEYQTQQHKLFPPLAFAFGFHFASYALWEAYQVINDEARDILNLSKVKNQKLLWEFKKKFKRKFFSLSHFWNEILN